MTTSDKVFYNHSQLEELRMSKEELRNRRLNVRYGTPIGFETPLGHAYSIILEEFSRKGLESNPNPKEFLDYMKQGLKKQGHYHEANHLDFKTRTYYPDYTSLVAKYIVAKGLDVKSCTELMFEIAGDVNVYREENIVRYHKTFPHEDLDD